MLSYASHACHMVDVTAQTSSLHWIAARVTCVIRLHLYKKKTYIAKPYDRYDNTFRLAVVAVLRLSY